MYVLWENKNAYVLCSLSYTLVLIGDKIIADHFKDKITPYLKENDRLKLAQDVALDDLTDKGKPLWKISYKVLKEEDIYDPLLDIYPYTTLIQLTYFLCGSHHCVTVVGKWIFDSYVLFHFLSQNKIWTTVSLTITKKKGTNGYKG